MKSKFLCGVCMLVILMGLSACAKWEPEVSGDEAASGSAVATEHAKPVKKGKEPDLEEVKQLQRIRTERKEWITSIQDEAYSSGIWYMISDLNQNGRLEVVVEMSCGSGGFINRRAIYEVSEDGKSLIKYKVTDSETAMELAAPGLVTVDAYWDGKTGMYYYAGENYTNPDGYRFGYSPRCFYLKDNEYQEKYMKVYREESKEDGSLTYFNQKDKKITKDEYERVQREFWQGKEKRKAEFYWQKADTLLEEKDADVDLLLAKSWKEFSVK